MKNIAIAAALLAASTAVAAADQPTPDKGTLVVGVGTAGPIFPFELEYRTVGPGREHDTTIPLAWGGAYFDHGPDFEGPERGVVWIDHLAPGNYEFYTFRLNSYPHHWHPEHNFSVPFTIRAGQTTYVGDFSSSLTMGKGLFGIVQPVGGYFVVTDKHDRDIPIAKKLEPALQPVTIEVPDVSALGLPFMLNQPPATPPPPLDAPADSKPETADKPH